MTWFNFLLLILAGDALLVAWFKGSLFATFRAKAQAWQSSSSNVKWFFGELLSCSKCLPLHMSITVYVLYLSSTYIGMHIVIVLALYGATSRLYNGLAPYMYQDFTWTFNNQEHKIQP